MPKSQYPNNYDTSKELPPVRDNILEVGSDAINSLRSAIIQIERTLGINPQGSSGNTVASRLSGVVDESGNLKPSALTTAGILSGPIHNSDVSDSAAILEKKLRLDFPTRILQTEISQLQKEIDDILEQLAEIQARFSAHVNDSAINRHPASAISVTPTDLDGSDTAIKDIEEDTVQSALEDIHSKHIQYTGADISPTNNSHLANQIYYDNVLTSALTDADDAQEAIDDAFLSIQGQTIIHQDSFHTNSLLSRGNIDSPTEDDIGRLLIENTAVSYSKNLGDESGTTLMTLNASLDISSIDLQDFDLVRLVGGTEVYLIESLNTTGNNLDSINVYGVFEEPSSVQLINLYKNNKTRSVISGLCLGVKEEASLSSRNILQVFNPNSAYLITENILPLEISPTNKTLTITVTNETLSETRSIDLEIYSTASISARQNIDSILYQINKQFAQEYFPAQAYRVDFSETQSEILIAVNMPDDSTQTFSITATQGSDTAIISLGLNNIAGIKQYSKYGTEYVIHGAKYESLNTKLDSTELSFTAAGNSIIAPASIDFLDLGIKKGDIVNITNVSSANDFASFKVSSVVSGTINIDGIFAGNSVDNTRVTIYGNSISLADLNFDVVSAALGACGLDIFLDKNRNLFYYKTFEYAPPIDGSSDSYFSITRIEGYNENSTYTLNVTKDSSDSVFFSINNAPGKNITGDNNEIVLYSGDDGAKFSLFVTSISDIVTYLGLGNTISVDITTFSKLDRRDVFKLGEVVFEAFKGRINGRSDLARVYSNREVGSVDIDSIGTSAKYELTERPLDELRANGVVTGLEATASIGAGGFYEIELIGGIAYVGGKRFQIDSISNYLTDIDSTVVDKIYIGINIYGELVVKAGDSAECISTISTGDSAVLGSAEYDGVTLLNYDLRLFIDSLDLKILNSVKVSPVPGMGHFTSIPKAISYAKRFSELYPKAGTPIVEVKSGIYTDTIEVDYTDRTSAAFLANLADYTTQYTELGNLYGAIQENGFYLDRSIYIRGEGPTTKYQQIINLNFSDGTETIVGIIPIIGENFSLFPNTFQGLDSSDDLDKSITIENIKFVNTKLQISDTEDVDIKIYFKDIVFDFENRSTTFFSDATEEKAIDIIYTTAPKEPLIVGPRIFECTFNTCHIGVLTDDDIFEHLINNNNLNTLMLHGCKRTAGLGSFYYIDIDTDPGLSSNFYAYRNDTSQNYDPNLIASSNYIVPYNLNWFSGTGVDTFDNGAYFSGGGVAASNFQYSESGRLVIPQFADNLVTKPIGTWGTGSTVYSTINLVTPSAPITKMDCVQIPASDTTSTYTLPIPFNGEGILRAIVIYTQQPSLNAAAATNNGIEVRIDVSPGYYQDTLQVLDWTGTLGNEDLGSFTNSTEVQHLVNLTGSDVYLPSPTIVSSIADGIELDPISTGFSGPYPVKQFLLSVRRTATANVYDMNFLQFKFVIDIPNTIAQNSTNRSDLFNYLV